MEPYPQRQGREDLQTSRSRTSSRVSVGESSFGALDIHDSDVVGAPPHLSAGINRAPAIVPLSSPNFNPSTQQSSAFLASSSPQLYAPPPLSFQNPHLQDWGFTDPTHSSETPLLRLEQPHDQGGPSTVRTGYTSEPGSYTQDDMSAMGVQYYPRFDASTSRSSYTWPVFDPAAAFPDQESGLLDPFTEQAFIPNYSRSISSSPSQGTVSVEQRELKRQRDQARRDSKTRFRRERSSSNSYHPPLSTTPDIIQRSVGNYSQSMSTPSNEATVNLPIQPFMNPPQDPTTRSPELYHAQYPMANNDFSSGYLMSYSSAQGASSIPSFDPRPLSMSSMPSMPSMPAMSSAPDLQFYYGNAPTNAPQESPDTVRIVHSRPKPQCWEHGCNGRQFSTFSNLLRHQREKSGAASKPTCPKCGAEFTRTTARNGHMAHEKCKQRRNS